MVPDQALAADATEAGLALEEAQDDTPLEIAPARRRVTTDKQDIPVDTLHMRVRKGKIDPQPDFQRYFVWSPTKASRLIESLLLDIPIPVIYVAEEPDGKYVVVDGQQRLTSVCAFIDGQFPNNDPFKLSGLQVLTELNGKLFSELDTSLQNHILNTTLRLIVIQQDADPDVKFEIFERLNLGAEKLNDQELRNSMYRGSYNDLLRVLAENPHMLKIMDLNVPHRRMVDCQLILRFFAMWRNSHLKYNGPMKRFLNRELEDHRDPSLSKLAEMRAVFEKSIEMAFAVFGRRAFRRFNSGWSAGSPNGGWEVGKVNAALWDSVLYTFSYYDKPQIIPIADRILEEFLDLMTNDYTFLEYVGSTTVTAERIRYCAEAWRDRLDDLVDTIDQGPRTFSHALKQHLFDASPTCQICGQWIRDIDDAEVDHIEHYWRGGKTIPENARLTHRYCNRSRGARA